MITFILCFFTLIAGYCIYENYIDRTFDSDETRDVSSIVNADGVDYVVLPSWKAFLIQFLNIAGTGPIFGAIAGAISGFHATQSPMMARCINKELLL